MSKERTSISVDPEVASYLKQEGVNASGTVNRLVKAEMGGQASEHHLIQLRLEQVESDIESLRSRLDNKMEERDRLQSRLDTAESVNAKKIQDAVDVFDDETLTPDNIAVENWADDMGIPPEEFVARVKQQRE